VSPRWREAPGCSAYEVSDWGQVRRVRAGRGVVPGRLRKPYKIPTGYEMVDIWQDGIRTKEYVHRLVLRAFVGEPPTPEHECHHIDNDRSNNRLTNLEWATVKENSFHRRAHGTHIAGEQIQWSKLTAAEVRQIRKLYTAGNSIYKLAPHFGVCPQNIHAVVTFKTWKEAI
jgi:hypothetical protein